MELDEMMARLSIQDTLAQYVRWADAGRAEAFAGVFAEDGVYTLPDRVCKGREAIAGFLQEMAATFSAHLSGGRIRHHVSSVFIELQGPDVAKASAYFIAVGPHGPDHWGNYRDRLIRVGDRWLFAERRVQIDGRLNVSAVTLMD